MWGQMCILKRAVVRIKYNIGKELITLSIQKLLYSSNC